MQQVLETALRSPAARAGRLLVDLQRVTRISPAVLALVASAVAHGVAIEARPVLAGSDPIASAGPVSLSVAAVGERHRRVARSSTG